MRHKILLVSFTITSMMGGALAQARSATGQATDENGEPPIINAHIKAVGSSTGTYQRNCLI